MSEALHRLPPTAIALMATTDGILFVGGVSDINTSGPVAQVFKRARVFIDDEPDPPIWELKHVMPRVLCFKTRGEIPIVPDGWSDRTHLAKAGARLPDDLEDVVDQAHFAERLYRERDYETKFDRRELTSLSEQHRTGCDVISKVVPVRLSWDYDWKNEPIEPVTDVEGVVSFSTKPWGSIREFEERREGFEDWKRSRRRVLRTSHDYEDVREWIALRATRKALRTNSRGVMPNFARAVVVAAIRQPLRERKSYKEIAEILARATGCFVTEQQIKDIRRKRDLIERQCVSQLSAKDIEFARGYGANPIAINQLREAIVPGSIAERQFAEIWERRRAASANRAAEFTSAS